MSDITCTCTHPLSEHDEHGCQSGDPFCDCLLRLPLPGPGIYRGMSHEEYHRLPYVSASFLKTFRECPADALLPRKETEAMLLGQALHCYVLEGPKAFYERFAVEPEPPMEWNEKKGEVAPLSKNTNKWRDLAAKFKRANEGKIILPSSPRGSDISTEQVLAGMSASLRSHPFAGKVLNHDGIEELTVIGDDPETGTRCKARIDRQSGRNVIAELKMCSNIGAFDRQIRDMNYHVQAGHYMNVAVWAGLFRDFSPTPRYDGDGEVLDASPIGDLGMAVFLAVDPAPAHAVRTVFLSSDYLDWSRHEAKRLVRLVAQCRERNEFPAYSLSGINSLDDVSPYQLLEELDKPAWVN